ncbi:anthocyanin 5-aromatic acyltransferase-like [Macadamia integrifolia]|uniref:anthocyanin 5-aromatic acyltransferase-like n=1 Tax=Macadamia integrifolia TaxID=60698 RepID=UPI001C52CAE7|nr:anthocyanin 5-aromatic acyltransferase-like [Macadamia integrifolia]
MKNHSFSLSSTLIHFYPLAGNLSWPHEPNQPTICYTEGDSVSFTVAESDVNFYHLASNNLKDATESCFPSDSITSVAIQVPSTPNSFLGNFSHSTYMLRIEVLAFASPFGPIVPTLAIQVTVFPNNGFCIAATHHHSVCDGRGFTHFMRTWASISKFGAESLSLESLPFLDRTAIKENNGIKKIILDDLDRFMGSKFVSGNRILRVMDIELKPNMDWVFAQYKKDEQTPKQSIPPSRLVAICAYTWICLLKAKAKAKAGVAVAAQLIGDAIYEGRQAILRGLEHSVSRLLNIKFRHQLGAAGSPQFGIYKTDFGIGRLKKVEMASIDRTEAMFLKESSNEEGGIEFDLVLNKKEMNAFVSVFVDGLNALNEHSLSPSTPRSLL